MLRYILKRVVATIPVMGIVAVFVFLMLRLSPGDPAAVIAGDYATAADIAQIREKLGLADPILVQFWRWIGQIMSGDLGISIFTNLPVTTLIAQRLEPTLMLSLTTLTFSVIVAVPLGTIAAWRAGGWLDRGIMVFSVAGFSIPVFVLGYMLIYVVSLKLNWLPVQGYRPLSEGLWPFLSHIMLPTLTLSAIYVALIARITRASVIEVLQEDYIRTARAKGQSETRVLVRHALANAAVPIVTVIGLGVALLIGGVVVTESVYNIPGLGRLVLDAVLKRDYPIIQGLILLFSFVYILVNLIVDLLYTILDPEDSLLMALTPRQEADPQLGMAVVDPAEEAVVGGRRRMPMWKQLARNPAVSIGGTLLLIIILISAIWPFFTADPRHIDPMVRLKVPDMQYWFGTDNLGRDVFIRAVHGGRISLAVGFSVAIVATVLGLLIGLMAGYVRALDNLIMRFMDGLMAIPGILLAIALISLSGSSLTTVIIAIGIPEIPRVVRLVRSVVLSVREEPYVEAAIAAGTRLPWILSRHVLPNTIPPLIVQATYICASAMLLEAILGFLGAGIPPEIPSWGNIMADGRVYFRLTPWIIFAPGIALALTVLAVNLLGDGLRDTLDPKLAKQL